MKKLIIVIAIAIISFSANAQIYVGGSINLSASSKTSFIFAPEVGYNFNDCWAAGAALAFSSIDGITSVGLKPYARWTALKLGPVNMFLDGYVGYTNTSNSALKTSVNSFALGVAPGLSIPVTKHLSFVGHVGAIEYANVEKNNIFTLNLTGSAFSAGIYYNF